MALDPSKFKGKIGDMNPNAVAYKKKPKKEQIPWEDELFHAVYVQSGTEDSEYLNKKLFDGLLQIRGVQYNIEDAVYMIPYFKRNILVKEKFNARAKSSFPICFSYRDFDDDGNQLSTSGFYCQQTAVERREFNWCRDCKTQVILAGFLVDANNEYILDKSSKPINIFVRAKGGAVGDLMKYFFECQELEVPFLFKGNNTDESDALERNYLNIFRRTIKITTETVEPYQGPNTPPNAKPRHALVLEGVHDLNEKMIEKLLDYEERFTDKIKEKFDLTKLVTESSKQYNKQDLLSLYESEEFKAIRPDFKHDLHKGRSNTQTADSVPDFMTIDEPNHEIGSTSTEPLSSDSIDDIPF